MAKNSTKNFNDQGENFVRMLLEQVQSIEGGKYVKQIRSIFEARGVKDREMPSIFICYSHKDKAWRDKLLEHLGPLNLEDKEVWSDLDLEAGDIWDKTIQEVLSQVKAVVLLVSPAFLNSKYIRNSELPVLLKRREQEGVRIIPLFVKVSLVEKVPFKYTNDLGEEITFYLNQFQSPPDNSPNQPLSKLTSPKKDDVLVSVAKILDRLIEESKKKR
jgi:hypothetical protein